MRNPFFRKFRIFIPFIMLAVLAGFTFAVYELWNGVLANVLMVKTITYWQALGLLALARILFGSFPGRRGGGFGPPWRRRMMMERWQSLTPQQRQEMRRRFGGWPRGPWCETTDAAQPPPVNTAKT